MGAGVIAGGRAGGVRVCGGVGAWVTAGGGVVGLETAEEFGKKKNRIQESDVPKTTEHQLLQLVTYVSQAALEQASSRLGLLMEPVSS